MAKFPNPPNPPKPDVKFDQDVLKALYQAELDATKDTRKAIIQARIDRIAADAAASVARDVAQDRADIEWRTAAENAVQERVAASWANEYALHQEVHKGYVEVAKGIIPRAIDRAKFIETVASAISAIYVAVISLRFVGGGGNEALPIPVAGIIPTFFLGLSIVLAASFVAFITESQEDEARGMKSDSTLFGKQFRRVNIFINWNKLAVMRSRRLLQASVISLGVAVSLLPLPFLTLENEYVVWLIAGFGLLLTIFLPIFIEPQR